MDVGDRSATALNEEPDSRLVSPSLLPLPPRLASPEEDEVAVSLRQSMYRLAGSGRGSTWQSMLECFVPLVVCGGVKCLSVLLEQVMQTGGGDIPVDLPSDLAFKYVGVTHPLPPGAVADRFFSSALSDWSARSVMALTSVGFFVLALATLCTVWYVTHEALEQVRERALLKAASGALAVAAFGALSTSQATGASSLMAKLHDAVREHSAFCHPKLYSAMYASGNTVVLLVAFAMCALLVPDLRARAAQVPSNRDVLFLARRMRWGRAVLYTLAPFLALSALESYVVTSSIAVYVVGEDNQKLMRLMANRSTLMFGAFYSLILACAYAPSETILRIRAMKLASDSGVVPTDRARWLQERSLKLSALDQLKTSLALLSPILTSVARQCIEGLIKPS